MEQILVRLSNLYSCSSLVCKSLFVTDTISFTRRTLYVSDYIIPSQCATLEIDLVMVVLRRTEFQTWNLQVKEDECSLSFRSSRDHSSDIQRYIAATGISERKYKSTKLLCPATFYASLSGNSSLVRGRRNQKLADVGMSRRRHARKASPPPIVSDRAVVLSLARRSDFIFSRTARLRR